MCHKTPSSRHISVEANFERGDSSGPVCCAKFVVPPKTKEIKRKEDKTTKRKLMSVVLAMAMALSLCISASAAADPVIDTIQVGEYTIEILPGSPEEFMTREKVLVSAYWYEGEDEFIEEFDCVKGEGNSVNVWINNT